MQDEETQAIIKEIVKMLDDPKVERLSLTPDPGAAVLSLETQIRLAERLKELEAQVAEKNQVISDLNAALTAGAKNAEIAQAAARVHRAGVAYEKAETEGFESGEGVPDAVVSECADSNCLLEKLLADAGLISI